MDFQFILPEKTSDLLKSSGDQFFVRQVYQSKEIYENLKVCKSLVQRKDPSYVIEHFDTYYSVLELKDSSPTTVTCLMRSFDLLYITVGDLAELLLTSLLGSGVMENRARYLNLTKMTLFLFINIVKRIDAIAASSHKSQVNIKQKKRGKQQSELLEQYPDWEKKRMNCLVKLYDIMCCQLEKLWNPPVVEENLINMICDICYRTIEMFPLHPETTSAVERSFQILGIAIKRFNHALNFPVRTLKMLRTFEHVARSLPMGINLLHEEYNISSVFSKLIDEIVEVLHLDAADTGILRNYSNFLTEFAALAPKLIIPHLSVLSDELLNCESHVIRNCILQIMGDAVVGELTSEELSEEMKEARNEFLEELLLHINDISAHVRAKVLHIWQHLKVEEAVPLSFHLRVIIGAVERLEDKTSTVRKQAVQLIKAFLERNPYASNLTLDELIKKHEEECKKMELLSEAATEERKKAEELDKHWDQILPELAPFVKQNILADAPVADTPDDISDYGPRVAELLVAKKYKEAIELARKAEHVSANEDLSILLSPDEKFVYYTALLKSYVFLANGCKNLNEQLGTQIKTVEFLQDCINFSKVITKGVPKIQELLLSKTNSDVFEAVELFTTIYMFGIKGTENAMRLMLNLIWSSDKEKREAVSNAYKRILFTTDQTGRAHAIKVVQNLSHFLEEIDYGNYIAMECLIAEWVATDDIDAVIVQVLFERFTLKLEGTTENESRLALQLLIMCSQAKSSIASSNISVIESVGLDDRGKHDTRIYTRCLEFMINSIDQSMSTKYYKRYDSDVPLVQKVIKMFTSFFFHPRIKDFDSVTTATLNFFYKLCQAPDVICQKIAIDFLKKFKEFSTKIVEISATQQAQALETPFSQPIPESQPVRRSQPTNSQEARMPVFLLTRFIFMIGHITLKEMIFLDIDVYNNKKIRQELREFEDKKKKNTAVNLLHRRTQALNMSATESLKRLTGIAAEPQQEPDEDLVGATAEDNIAEMITHICEEVLLSSEDALLAKIYPYVIEICKYPAKYRNQELQQAATLTLIRMMCLSAKFCETYLPFLINILNHTKNITIKCNIVIGLNDLTFRFPNVIEPWTGHLYAILHERNTELRLTAVKMLSHLILHEIIRVKGQIGDLALCIVDKNNEIRNITQQFFKEIANKSNILYNVLPDIISTLSDVNLRLEEDNYRIIMRYILGLIQKDRQVETLVEKLCLRFPVTYIERQWRDIAYCLSLLTYNERAIKKLMDNVHTYKDKLQIDEVHQSFKLIISNTSKLAKPELKALVAEFEKRVDDCLKVRDSIERDANASSDGVEGNVNLPRSDKNKQPSTRRISTSSNTRIQNANKSTGRNRRGKPRKSSSSSSEEEADRSKKGRSGKSRHQNDSDSSEEEHFSSSRRSQTGGTTQSQSARSNVSRTCRSIQNVVLEESESSQDERPNQKRGRGYQK